MIQTETDKHRDNGAHDEDHAHDRRVEPRRPLRPPLRSVAVWGPIAAPAEFRAANDATRSECRDRAARQ